MRDSIVFYRSFYEAINELEDPEDYKKSVQAIMEYGLNGIEPEVKGIVKAIFNLVKPQIDANNKRYENGTKGGRPKKRAEDEKSENHSNNFENQKKPNVNQKYYFEKPNVNENVNVNENENILKPFAQSQSPCAGKFLLNDGTEYIITENDVETFQQLYPGIDVQQELRNIQAWCLANPKNRKTRNGAKRFLNAWLSRSQNSARPEKKIQSKNRFNNFEQRDYNYAELEKQLLGG